MPTFRFDRYIRGQLMAEGVEIDRADNLQDAAQVAARIASKGTFGETPVLVYVSDNTERDRLREALEKLHSWLVCHTIADADDMMQSAPDMEQTARQALGDPHD